MLKCHKTAPVQLTHLGPLYSQGKPRPSSGHVSHFEGSCFLCPTSCSWVGVVQYDSLGTILYLGQRYTQVYNLAKKKKKSRDVGNYLLSWCYRKTKQYRRVKKISVTHLLVSICNGKQHTTAPCGRFSCNCDGKVIVERVRDEWLCEAAHVGVRAEAVGRVTLETRNKGDGGRKGDADQLRQVQGSMRTALCKETNMEVETTLVEGKRK